MIEDQQPAEDDPEICSGIIWEAWLAGQSVKQIAEQMGRTVATVLTILKEKQKSKFEEGNNENENT